MKLPLSVLELSPVGRGVEPSQAIRESVEVAKVADRLGFERIWIAEHHGMANIAASAPEVLIAHIAAVTPRIRVGAGGIMVPNHAPLHVVEVFRTLEALYPDRIDLGLGRAPGTDPVTAAALRRTDVEVNQLLAELLAFENDGFPERHPFAAITPMPSDVHIRSLWMLGSTLAGASIAAQLGVPYAFAGHFAMSSARDAMAHYKKQFEPSKRLAKPHAMLAITVVCGETDEEAVRLAAPIRVAIARNRTGRRGPVPSVEEALAYPFTPQETAIADEFMAGAILCGKQSIADRLIAATREFQADELMLSALLPTLPDRIASLERIAAALT